MKRAMTSLSLLILAAGTGSAATELEMEACKLTPEVKKELRLSPDQEPKVEKVFKELAPMRQQIEAAMAKNQQLRKSGAEATTIEKQTKDLIALENQCRDRGHQLLKPVLQPEQLAKVLELEDVHRKLAQRRAGSQQPEHR